MPSTLLIRMPAFFYLCLTEIKHQMLKYFNITYKTLALGALYICLICLMPSCKSEKDSIVIPPKAELHFGKAGGIANARSEFILSAEGKLYQQMNNGPKKFVSDLGAKKAIKIFQEALDLGIDKTDFKHPGNMTCFLIYNDGTKQNEINWGDPQFAPGADIKSFYDKLFELRP